MTINRRTVVKGLGGAGLISASGLYTPAISQGAAAKALKFVPQANLANFDPIWGTQYVVRNAAALVWDTLYGVDDTLTPRRQMVESESVSDDGTTWSFAEGPRQSPALWGGILGTEPFHWDQAVRDMADISRVTVIGRMGGSGLGRADMNAIGAFLDTIPAPAARITASDAGESLSRGANLFESMSCTSCHAGADFTQTGSFDVGTGRGATTRETVDAFAVPPLKGLIHSAPYLHDGSARTVREVIEKLVVTNKMMTQEMRDAGFDGSNLSEQDITDLVAFLESI